jgi:hypothetical protein
VSALAAKGISVYQFLSGSKGSTRNALAVKGRSSHAEQRDSRTIRTVDSG